MQHRDAATSAALGDPGGRWKSAEHPEITAADFDCVDRAECQKPIAVAETGSSKAQSSHGLLSKLWGGSEYSGLACSAVAALIAAFIGLVVKLLSFQAVPSFQMVLIRSVVVTAIAAVGLRRRGIALENWVGSVGMRRVVMARAVCGFIGISSFVYSVQVLPLKDATVLNFTLPIFTAVFCAVFVGEPWGVQEALSTAVSFLGVVLIARPELVWSASGMDAVIGSGGSSGDGLSSAMRTFGVAIAMLGALAGGAAYTLLRVAGKGGEHPLVPVFAFHLVSIPLSAIFMLATQTPVMPTLVTMSGCILFGVMSFAQQALLSRGMQLEKGSRASAMQYIKVLGSYLLGVAFLGEVATVPSVLGAIFICISSSVVAKQAGKK